MARRPLPRSSPAACLLQRIVYCDASTVPPRVRLAKCVVEAVSQCHDERLQVNRARLKSVEAGAFLEDFRLQLGIISAARNGTSIASGESPVTHSEYTPRCAPQALRAALAVAILILAVGLCAYVNAQQGNAESPADREYRTAKG